MTNTLHNQRAWVFDLDGTLTIAVHDFKHIRQRLGMADDADILATLAQTPEPKKQQLTEQLDELEAFYAHKAKPATGALTLIKYLAAQGCQLGIFTRNTKPMAILSLQAIGLTEYFDPQYIIGRDEAIAKPHPQGLNRLLTSWNVAPEQAVMVGDFRYDLEAGRRAGTKTVHIPVTAQRWPELSDHQFASLNGLLDTLSVKKS